jgi:prepilin-type N-terminal cleavage/methylation domain-containing protein
MKTSSHTSNSNRHGFTLIELLVVIAIIAILAGLLLPVIAKAKEKAKITKARTEIQHIEAGISQYYSDYSRYPISKPARNSVGTNDFTFGTYYRDDSGNQYILLNPKGVALPVIANGFGSPPYENCNAEIMSALLDLERFRSGMPTMNLGHALNPKKLGPYLDAKQASDRKSPGIGEDGVYRDPWGTPYIVTLDMNGDNKCRDALYRRQIVSGMTGDKGWNGLYRSAPGDNFEANKPVMVWSLGPDGLANPGLSATVAPNKDNILSW